MKKKLVNLCFKLISKKEHGERGVSLQYLFKKKKAHDRLIVIFSAFPRPGMPATYNYLKTTQSLNADKLFILDKFGYNQVGGYYLFHFGAKSPEDMVTSLIQKIVKRKKYKEVIFIGTSKGGYAAMYYGLKLKADAVIAGAPQYLLGNYLTDIPEKRKTLLGMTGGNHEFSVPYLNRLIKDRILNKESQQTKFYLHYSTVEHTYDEHISFLLEDLKKNGYQVFEDKRDYEKHQEVAIYFPPYLKETLQNLLRK
ncbi:accessory Sec system protein Asp2 [Listeria sp. PSOL-1]|uniref:accessory Sec system protein Asp2 n=1 Tax=Listeria sp. PSOL-1 TaxID=1844999 RepID=UPI0013D586DA|nr:accessory Sec system protein Asp2 [Listeria sp. PSOL-1]